MIFFVISLSRPFPTYLGLEGIHNVFFFFFFNFLNFFSYFFGVLYLGSGRNSSKRFFFYFLSFSAIPILFWLEKKLWWCFLIFWFFLEFSIMGCVGTHQNDFFYFLSFSAFPNLFWLENKQWWCFLIFWIYLLFF